MTKRAALSEGGPSARSLVGAPKRLPADRSVDHLSDEIGVAVMSRVFLDIRGHADW